MLGKKNTLGEAEQKKTICRADTVYEWKQEGWIETQLEGALQEKKHQRWSESKGPCWNTHTHVHARAHTHTKMEDKTKVRLYPKQCFFNVQTCMQPPLIYQPLRWSQTCLVNEKFYCRKNKSGVQTQFYHWVIQSREQVKEFRKTCIDLFEHLWHLFCALLSRIYLRKSLKHFGSVRLSPRTAWDTMFSFVIFIPSAVAY